MRESVAMLFSVVLAVGVAAALLVALVAPSKPAQAAFPGKNGWIAFEDSGSGIYTMSFTGKNVERLISLPVRGSSPAYSPDGKKIVFSEWSGLRDDIYVMNADSSNMRLVTDERKLPGEGMVDRFPAFSPSGRQIVFQRGWGQWDYDLYRINLDGSNLRPVFRSPKRDEEPVWSPDGERIAFLHGNSIATVRPDGTGLTVFGHGFHPDWSPDSSQLTFAAFDRRGTHTEVYKMNADGIDVTKLTVGSSPVFSPGGGRILFVGSRDGDSGIFTMRADGSGELQVTHNTNSMSYLSPDWQPVQ